ncbi:MAG: hypothetical protein AAF125_18780 [Chloroflexota bacterium]
MHEFWWTVRYMIGQIALKAAVGGGLWFAAWYWIDEGLTISNPIESAFILTLIAGFMGVVGLVIGGGIGAMCGVGVGVLNLMVLRGSTNLRLYRRWLVALGASVGFVLLLPILAIFEPGAWMVLAGSSIAAIGVALSAYTYLPAYIDKFYETSHPNPFAAR